jgi:hypothetical protein
MKLIKYLTFSLSLITLVSAQSKPCQDSIAALLSDKELNACLPLLALAPLASGNITLTQLSTAADTICPLKKCPDGTITKNRNSVEQACSSDLTNQNVLAVDFFLTYYSPIRDSACLKNSTNGYCFIETLSNAQLNNISPFSPDFFTTYLQAPSAIVCTDCNKNIASYFFTFQNTNPNINKQFTDKAATIKTALDNKCGSDFTSK